MPHLVDTTVRLLSQEPLAGRIATGDVLRIAEILDGAGFACLEVSGGGVFDASVRRGVESPWERIRAIDARTTTPLGIALRGRFLVGSKPVSPDIVRRFGIREFPSLVLIDRRGVVARLEGRATGNEIDELLRAHLLS